MATTGRPASWLGPRPNAVSFRLPKTVYEALAAGVPPVQFAASVIVVAVFDATTPVLEPAVTCAPANSFVAQAFVESVRVFAPYDVPAPVSRRVYVTPAPAPLSFPAGTEIVKLLAFRGVAGFHTPSIVIVVALFETTVPDA